VIGRFLTDDQIKRTLERYDLVDIEIKGVAYGASVLITVVDPELGMLRLTVPADVLAERGEPEEKAPKTLLRSTTETP